MSKTKTKRTHWKKLNNPNYLGTYALEPDSDMILTIHTARQEEVTGSDGKKEDCLVLHFKEDVKPMILNVTNAKQIERIHETPYIEEWEGKKIQLYIAQINAFGQQVDAIRIRPKAPKVNKQELTPDHDKWSAAVQSLSEKATSIDAIRKRYTLTDEYAEILQQEAETEVADAGTV